jgi:L-lactate dehydrogenase complex protein LldG
MADQSRDKILLKIKQALATPVPAPFPQAPTGTNVFATPQEKDLEILFAQQFTKLQGKFAFCESEKELASQLNMLFIQRNWNALYCREEELRSTLETAGFRAMTATELDSCDAAITSCEYLVARTGSMLLSSAQQSGRTVSVYAPIHICIAYTDQLVYDTADGLERLRIEYGQEFPSFVTLATGPSRTADIEKTLVVGVHGPKEVFCFLVQRN